MKVRSLKRKKVGSGIICGVLRSFGQSTVEHSKPAAILPYKDFLPPPTRVGIGNLLVVARGGGLEAPGLGFFLPV
jgi:hypothetical protein